MKFAIEERPADSPFVERIWRARGERTGTFLSQAATHWEVVVTKHEGKATFTVRGPETKATPMDFTWTDAEFFGISFRLGAFMPHLPPGIVRDLRDRNLPEATSKSFWLHGAAWQYPNFENADAFVGRLVREGLLVRDPVVDAVLQGYPHELSLRSVQYRFVRAIGLTYRRTIRQIERARLAAALLEEGMPILDVVHEAGYFDQPHLTRSLRRFMGETPAQIARAEQPN